MAEVNNTPWGETHPYVFDLRRQQLDPSSQFRFQFQKEFHVSPFMKMDQRYYWRFSLPGDALNVTMVNNERRPHDERASDTNAEERIFHAALAMERQPITSRNLSRALWRHPFLTGRIIVAIYWQALRLHLKNVPFVPHPKHSTPTPMEQQTS